MEFLADSGPSSWVALPWSLTWSVSLSSSFPTTYFSLWWKKPNNVLKAWNTRTRGFSCTLLSNYCIRTANLNRDYFCCWLLPVVFSSPPSISSGPTSRTCPFLIPIHCLTKKATVWGLLQHPNLSSELWCLVGNLENALQQIQSHEVKIPNFSLGMLILLLRIHFTKLKVSMFTSVSLVQ